MRVHLTLTLDRALVAKAAGDKQGGLFGDLIPTQKVVRRKTGKTHTQTFHTKPGDAAGGRDPRIIAREAAEAKYTQQTRAARGRVTPGDAPPAPPRPVTRDAFEPLKPRKATPAKPPAEAVALVTAARAERRAEAAEAIKRARSNEAATRALGNADLAREFHHRSRDLAASARA